LRGRLDWGGLSPASLDAVAGPTLTTKTPPYKPSSSRRWRCSRAPLPGSWSDLRPRGGPLPRKRRAHPSPPQTPARLQAPGDGGHRILRFQLLHALPPSIRIAPSKSSLAGASSGAGIGGRIGEFPLRIAAHSYTDRRRYFRAIAGGFGLFLYGV
jgi:hypothetical protein